MSRLSRTYIIVHTTKLSLIKNIAAMKYITNWYNMTTWTVNATIIQSFTTRKQMKATYITIVMIRETQNPLPRMLHDTIIWKTPVKCSSGNSAHFSSSWRSQNVGRYNRSAAGPNEPLLATRHPHIRTPLPACLPWYQNLACVSFVLHFFILRST